MKFIVNVSVIIEAHNLDDAFERLGKTIPELKRQAADFEDLIERGRVEIKEDDGTLQVQDEYKDFKATFEGELLKVVHTTEESYFLIKEVGSVKDKVKTQNGRIYSRKALQKDIKNCQK